LSFGIANQMGVDLPSQMLEYLVTEFNMAWGVGQKVLSKSSADSIAAGQGKKMYPAHLKCHFKFNVEVGHLANLMVDR
jgi:hypothetical protein